MIVVYFGHWCTKRVQLPFFFIEMALEISKTKYSMRQRYKLTQTLMTHRKAAARLLCGRREIAARWLLKIHAILRALDGHRTATLL